MLPIVQQVAHHKGVSPNKPGEFHQCFHKHHVVGFKAVSSGWYQSGNELEKVQAPYMGILGAGELDRNGIVGPYDMYWAKFDWDAVRIQPSGLSISVELNGIEVRRNHRRNLVAGEARKVLALFQELVEYGRRPDLASRLRAGARVVDLIAIWADMPSSGGGERAVRIYRNLIEQHAADPAVSLADIAARVGLSADHLAVLFQQEMGMPPVEYRTRLRMLRARELLLSTARPIRSIAREVGIPNASHFTRLFRATFGASPRSYAQAHAYPFPSEAAPA